MYYACFRLKKEKQSQNGYEIIRKPFETREEARAYLEANRDFSKYDQFWTE